MSRTWAEIDLAATARNVSALKRASGRPLIAVVKANAYGHGAVAVGRAAFEAGARMLAVATVGEASELGDALGRSTPLLVLGALVDEEALEAVALGATTVIHEREDLDRIARAARSLGTIARVHLEVDSGLARHGASPGAALELAEQTLRTSGVSLLGLMTHMARATVREATLEQIARFRPVVDALRARVPGLLVHAAATSASLLHEESRMDAIRPGIALHGIDPDGAAARTGVALSPVLSLRAQVVRVREVEAGTPVGYGATWTAP
ncbi:alanine racemase, partial [bacterium]|nr:alanine racemase [bacterium]